MKVDKQGTRAVETRKRGSQLQDNCLCELRKDTTQMETGQEASEKNEQGTWPRTKPELTTYRRFYLTTGAETS